MRLGSSTDGFSWNPLCNRNVYRRFILWFRLNSLVLFVLFVKRALQTGTATLPRETASRRTGVKYYLLGREKYENISKPKMLDVCPLPNDVARFAERSRRNLFGPFPETNLRSFNHEQNASVWTRRAVSFFRFFFFLSPFTFSAAAARKKINYRQYIFGTYVGDALNNFYIRTAGKSLLFTRRRRGGT